MPMDKPANVTPAPESPITRKEFRTLQLLVMFQSFASAIAFAVILFAALTSA
ncbi:hypothetical protein [Streptomyces sp. NPDC088915]|uniref:hypothetical protein n=1 Tax=Streptomyces sp. NPDC088915 TaxID=3365912 RepID=UPI00380A5861